MDFFEAQDESRRITRLLVVFFVAAVIAIVVLTNLLIITVLAFSDTSKIASGAWRHVYDWETFGFVSAIVVGFIAAGSAYRVGSLSRGGEKIAEMMGGELLADHGGDLSKRRLLNIVEEMAIASGTPVPPVYLMPEESINAFAAGYSPGDAVIGVTRGSLENFSRDEMQGVIAHEFSHILNGDMRMNIRLTGILFGILMLAVVGRMLVPRRYGAVAVGRSRRDGGGGIMALGVGLIVIGFVGKFFGSLIKAGVSRQREYLADASAVQFTRNPDGIAGALKRIGGFDQGTILADPEAEEYSHGFFAPGVKVMLNSIMATHPPLGQRIARIDPRWQGDWLREPPPAPTEDEIRGFAAEAASGAADGAIDADRAIGDIGQPAADQLEMARNVIAAIPAALADGAREPYSARAVVYLVLLDPDELVRARQIDHLEDSADIFVFARFRELLPLASEIRPEMRLPLVEMALGRLRQLSAPQYEKFIGNVDALIRADQKIGLTEWALHKYLTRNLAAAFEGRHARSTVKSIASVREELGVLLSMLAYSDGSAGISPAAAFDAGKAALEEDVAFADKSTLALARLNEAVDRLAELRPLRKPKVLKACIATITADGRVAPVEKELVRAIADCLDCPMPPIR